MLSLVVAFEDYPLAEETIEDTDRGRRRRTWTPVSSTIDDIPGEGDRRLDGIETPGDHLFLPARRAVVFRLGDSLRLEPPEGFERVQAFQNLSTRLLEAFPTADAIDYMEIVSHSPARTDHLLFKELEAYLPEQADTGYIDGPHAE